ncbi:MAG: hypothetical protein KGL39_05105 [Patescibacteria group bacterium]|nr:hypothetical protein [Patescibacteria group bacterium]
MDVMEASCDFETRSDVDIKMAGAYRYFESPHARALILCYSIDKGPIQTWLSGPCPDDLRLHIEHGGLIRAHNAAFERLCFAMLHERHGWPRLKLEQFRCTAVEAAAMALPRSLERVCDALGVKAAKDKRGAKLIKLFSIPRAPGPTWNEPEDHPKEFQEFIDYCKRDVEAEQEVASRLVPLSDEEWKVYALNERINDRGLRIDVKSALAAVQLIEKAKAEIDREITLATGGSVTATTQVARLQAWCESRGVNIPTLGKDDVDDFLHIYDDLPDDVRRALELRAEGAKPSTDKIGAMLERVCRDGRAKGVYLHHGAGQTGRFSSRGVQAHNMPKYRKIFEDAHIDQTVLFDAIRTAEPQVLKTLYGDELGRPLHLLSDAVRGFIWAAPGKEFIVADYSSIEGRMAAWFAGEDWKLEAFRALDRGEGHGIYELAAAGIYGVAPQKVTKTQRQTGKVAELSAQYAGGVGAISRFSRTMHIKLHDLHAGVSASAGVAFLERAEKRFEEQSARHDEKCIVLGREGWLAAELIKLGWRAKHPAICQAWKDLEEAAINATLHPGERFDVMKVSYLVAHDFLWCRLPSGRCLAYGKPQMKEVEAPWADKTLEPDRREKKLSLTARGVESQSEKWMRFPLYGGSLFNNCVQGAARDVLVNGMVNAEAAGFPINLHTHDEMGAEIVRGSRTVKEFEDILCRLPEWCADLPMAAAGWTGKRYRK